MTFSVSSYAVKLICMVAFCAHKQSKIALLRPNYDHLGEAKLAFSVCTWSHEPGMEMLSRSSGLSEDPKIG